MRILPTLLLLAGVAAADWHTRPRAILLLKKKRKLEWERFSRAVLKVFPKQESRLFDMRRDFRALKDRSIGIWRGIDLTTYGIEEGKKPYFKDPDDAAIRAPNSRARKVIFDHRGWLYFGSNGDGHLEREWKAVCRMVAELIDDNLMAIYFPTQKKWLFAGDEKLTERLRAKDAPVKLGLMEAPGKLEPEKDAPKGMVAVLAKAMRRARKDWPAFLRAFHSRGRTTGAYFDFTVTYGDIAKPGTWKHLRVSGANPQLVVGTYRAKDRSVRRTAIKTEEMIDWRYVARGPPMTTVGNYVMEALREGLK